MRVKTKHSAWLAESVDVALAVERHRWAWQPAEASVVLIAESHVFTSPDDLALSVRQELIPPGVRNTPDEFVRLIYCLGYGEDELLSGVPKVRNAGTLGFWSYFGRLAGTGIYPRASTLATRLAWKAQTLEALCTRGVWLLDASVHAFYSPGGVRLSAQLGKALHNTWWNYYGHWLVEQLPPSVRLWAIGKGVHDQLIDERVPLSGFIYQPQAARGRNIDMNHGWNELLEDIEGERLLSR